MTQDLQSAMAIQTLRGVQEMNQSLLGAAGPRALFRRFGEALQKQCVVQAFDCAKILGSGAKTSLKRRGVVVEGLATFDEAVLSDVADLLSSSQTLAQHLRDGCMDLRVGERKLTATIVPDPYARSGTLLLWQLISGGLKDELRRLQTEHMVRVMQNEGRWLRRLDKTQARLYRDDLTGLYNYRYLEIALENELRRADRFQTQFCLLFIDLDGFKPINDQHGHCSGSSVLKQVADVLREAVREIDIAIRYGGDEFVVVLLGATCAKGVLAAERVRRHIEAREFHLDGGARTRLTASIGVAAYPEHARDRATLLRLADATMYDSKKAGKNRVTVVARSESWEAEPVAR